MLINANNIVSITEANRNFSRIARLVDKNGAAIILKNNTPKYIVLEYSQLAGEEYASDDEVTRVAKRIIAKNIKAFQELAK